MKIMINAPNDKILLIFIPTPLSSNFCGKRLGVLLAVRFSIFLTTINVTIQTNVLVILCKYTMFVLRMDTEWGISNEKFD